MRKFALPAVILLLCGAASARADEGFAGTWDTTFGPVTLIQKGKKVTGSYYDGKASLEGTVEKQKLTFTYKETGEAGEAWFELSEDGKSFNGKYLATGQKDWIEWNGTRQGDAPAADPARFTGTWDTTFGPVTLIQKGKKVTGSYYDGKATLVGLVEKQKLTFTYKESNTGEVGEAWFELSDDGKSFNGKYLATGQKDWIEWNGTRK